MSHRTRRVVFALLAAAICPYFIDLGGLAIWDANEAFYVETPREMIERGDYISPSFNYEPRFNKPILSYWIVAAFYRLFGVSVGVQRVPIAIGGVVLIWVAFFLARVGESRAPAAGMRSIEAPLWAALGLAVSPRLFMFARRILIDIYISMFMALTLLFFAAAERYPERRKLFLLLMYVSAGLGMLTKGPIAVVLPALVLGLYLLVHREMKRVMEMMLPIGLLIVVAIALPWYAALYQRYGWTYITSFFIGENIERYTSGAGVQVSRGPWFYLPVVISDSFPLSMYLLPAAAYWFADTRRHRVAPDPALRIRTLLWLWILVIVAFFSVSAAKQDLYIFPIVPAVAALGGCAIARAVDAAGRARKLSRTMVMATALTGLILIAIGGGLMYLLQIVGPIQVLKGATPIAVIAVVGGATAIVLCARGKIGPAVVAGYVSALVFNWVLVSRTLPSFETYKPVPLFAALLRDRATQDDVIATYNVALPSLVYYLKRHVMELFDETSVTAVLSSNRTVYIVMTSDDRERMMARSPVASCEIDRRPTLDVKLRNLLAGEPLPDLVVVTNRCQKP
jgi:4-amino-4-deoxy-L-arabinose transferase-like glycosyltransferase